MILATTTTTTTTTTTITTTAATKIKTVNKPAVPRSGCARARTNTV